MALYIDLLLYNPLYALYPSNDYLQTKGKVYSMARLTSVTSCFKASSEMCRSVGSELGASPSRARRRPGSVRPIQLKLYDLVQLFFKG
jgi:hypothetical protein